ncbi:16S rRNA G966 N2-methylase RsmD [Wenyingzhuangia heitensis]|uniref:16S rRNA G966 N2-methylase RsmD n=1 Tax=Wenyingzhuangia heitensis TaxID=1487859 RepID=A0ABX0UAY5_9FLAO|nr:class I SAM-dependent methyltransferase [Wenyingzhuangia heitensis]NIJ44222.1 16S rRNA G966 N2-methylase RsmD [Wenyingzhuangia heitensis]
MNPSILLPEVQDFINQNLKTDITKLVLKGSPFPSISTIEIIEQIEAKKKCEKKLPTWFLTKDIYYPNKLNIEQTSSEATANYKSNLIKGDSIIDITGGYGIDCVSFSKHFKQVTHCELNSELSKIVKHNLQELGTKNIECIQGDGVQYILDNHKTYDWIYVDPSRRNNVKGKVFLLQDCLPNIPKHLDALVEKSHNILIKNSPLIDITSCINELSFVKEVFIIALQNEVKEVLVHVEKGYQGTIKINAVNIQNTIDHFNFIYQKEYNTELSEPLKYIYEPNSAILKSGGFEAVSEVFKIKKLHKHSHLYTSNELIDFSGRAFKIVEVLPYNKKQLLKKLPSKKANITTRNFRESVATIRKKTGIKEGGDIYLFFTTNKKEEQIVLLCKK